VYRRDRFICRALAVGPSQWVRLFSTWTTAVTVHDPRNSVEEKPWTRSTLLFVRTKDERIGGSRYLRANTRPIFISSAYVVTIPRRSYKNDRDLDPSAERWRTLYRIFRRTAVGRRRLLSPPLTITLASRPATVKWHCSICIWANVNAALNLAYAFPLPLLVAGGLFGDCRRLFSARAIAVRSVLFSILVYQLMSVRRFVCFYCAESSLLAARFTWKVLGNRRNITNVSPGWHVLRYLFRGFVVSYRALCTMQMVVTNITTIFAAFPKPSDDVQRLRSNRRPSTNPAADGTLPLFLAGAINKIFVGRTTYAVKWHLVSFCPRTVASGADWAPIVPETVAGLVSKLPASRNSARVTIVGRGRPAFSYDA